MAITPVVKLTLTLEELADIDRVKHPDVPRAAWIKRLCRDAVLAHDRLREVEDE